MNLQPRTLAGAAALLLVVACSDDGSIAQDDGETGGSTSGASSVSASVSESGQNTTASATAATTDGGTSTTDASTTADGGSGDDGYEDDDGGTGCNFTCPNPPADPTVPGPDCLCPEGEKCMAWANDGGYIPNAFRCSPVDPTPAGVGDQCYVEGSAVSGVDNCEVGAACWDVNYNTNEGFCHRICGAVPDEPICPDGQICNSIGALHLCVDTCDPLESATCQDGTACQPANAGFGCMASPFPQGGNAIGGGCISDHACEPGAICVDKDLVPDCGYDGCCAELCDMGPPPYGCSQEDTNCWAIPDAPDLPSYQDVGVCRL